MGNQEKKIKVGKQIERLLGNDKFVMFIQRTTEIKSGINMHSNSVCTEMAKLLGTVPPHVLKTFQMYNFKIKDNVYYLLAFSTLDLLFAEILLPLIIFLFCQFRGVQIDKIKILSIYAFFLNYSYLFSSSFMKKQ